MFQFPSLLLSFIIVFTFSFTTLFHKVGEQQNMELRKRVSPAPVVAMEATVVKVVKKRARQDEVAAKIPRKSAKAAATKATAQAAAKATTVAKAKAPAAGKKKGKKKTATPAPAGGDEDEFGVHAMTVTAIKDLLNTRELSTNGDKKVLSKRLLERLVKEKDPDYKPKPKGRFCKECPTPTLMRKRNGVRGPFFGCSNYPQCCYTEGRGFAMVSNKPEPWFNL
jgi:hypothetical protein